MPSLNRLGSVFVFFFFQKVALLELLPDFEDLEDDNEEEEITDDDDEDEDLKKEEADDVFILTVNLPVSIADEKPGGGGEPSRIGAMFALTAGVIVAVMVLAQFPGKFLLVVWRSRSVVPCRGCRASFCWVG
ncbi:hypothetical protein QBC45DRAFT_430622 [Copromyces sp. CBS 386.78]|nr:hypothetical protein QBC45DRAFT_430622 [Copromyces sp. CBS 386.78]